MSGAAAELLLFAKAPEAGRVKTRLMPHLSAADCMRLQDALVRHAVARLAAAGPWRTRIVFTPASGEAYFRGFGLPLRAQAGDGLGDRMLHALRQAFSEGAARAVLVGTDIPSLAPEDIGAALDALDGADLVFGPAADGGFYLVGLKATPPEGLFDGVPWSRPETLVRAERRAERLGLRTSRIRTRSDVDRIKDLERLAGEGRFREILRRAGA